MALPSWLKFILSALVTQAKKKGIVDVDAQTKPEVKLK